MVSMFIIVVSVAIYLLIYIARNFASAPKEFEQGFGENFPTVEILEPVLEEPAKDIPAVVQRAPAKVAVQKRPDVDRSPQTRSPEVPVSAKKERLVRLNSKSEAKRAFLYSEIFNRKY